MNWPWRRKRKFGRYPDFDGLYEPMAEYERVLQRYRLEREIVVSASYLERHRWSLVWHCGWNLTHPWLNSLLFGPSSHPWVGLAVVLGATAIGGFAAVGFYRWRTRMKMADLEWLVTAS